MLAKFSAIIYFSAPLSLYSLSGTPIMQMFACLMSDTSLNLPLFFKMLFFLFVVHPGCFPLLYLSSRLLIHSSAASNLLIPSPEFFHVFIDVLRVQLLFSPVCLVSIQ